MDERDDITGGDEVGWPEFKDNGAAVRFCYRHKECDEWYYYPDRVKDINPDLIVAESHPKIDGEWQQY